MMSVVGWLPVTRGRHEWVDATGRKGKTGKFN